MTKVLAVLLLLVAGALVFTVMRQRAPRTEVVYEPRAVTLPSGDLGADEKATIAVFETVSPSVVHITNITTRRDAFTMDVLEVPRGTGSGFIWDEQGHVVTNYHVVKDAQTARVTLSDGTTYDGKVLGAAADKDIAVVKIDAPPSKLRKVALGDSTTLRVGQKVLAIGNPFGLDQTLTTGVISGLGREIKSADQQRTIYDVIQTDASINPGNSGGPLLDSHGRVIGINTAIYSPTGSSAGIGFAVPMATVNRMVPQILQYKRVIRPIMGVNLAGDQVAKALNVKGVIVHNVIPGGPAARAGLTGMTRAPDGGWVVGDVLVQIDGTQLNKSDDLFQVLDKRKIGDEVTLEIVNQGRSRTVKLKLEASP
jgi:S1-C subfamily serine protease